jgi:hypothetical protein
VLTNSLFVIKPYKWNGTWVFDDAAVGLIKEPFVSGVPAIIEEATKNISNAEKGFVAIFSSKPFPGFDVELDFVKEEYSGNWYKWTKTNQEGWLCPALFKYFETAPQHLYIKVEQLK